MPLHIDQTKPKHAGNSGAVKEGKTKMFVSIFFAAFLFVFSYNVNAQNLKFMGVPMTTLKDFGDNIQKKVTLNNPKPMASGLTARIDEFAGIPKKPTIDIIYNLSNVKNPSNSQDLNNAKIAHVVIDFYSMANLGVSADLDEPDDQYLEFHQILKHLKKIMENQVKLK